MNLDNSTVENTTQTNTQDITIPTTGSYFHSYPDKDKSPNSKSIVVRNVSFDSDDMFDNGISYKTADGKELKLFNRGNGKVVYGLHTFYTNQNGKNGCYQILMIYLTSSNLNEFLRGMMIDLSSPVFERDSDGNEKLDKNGNKIDNS